MERNNAAPRKMLLPMVLVFVVINLLLVLGQGPLVESGLDVKVLLIGNSLLFFIFFITLWLHLRSMANQSTHVFMRNVYSGMLLKLFGGAIAAFVYIYMYRSQVNKPALFGCMALYALYSFIELRTVLQQSKRS